MIIDIQVSTSQLFLLQRDPAVTAWLGSLEGVGLSVEPVEGQGELQGWLLIAKGRKDDLSRLDSFLKQEQERHTVLQWPTDTMGGFKPTPATLWAVSVATGAHVEQVGWGKYVATGKTPAAAEAAKQMVLTIAERATAPYPPLGACIPPEDNVAKETPELYALVPHVPASSSPLPWDTSAIVAGRPLFRLRDVDTGNPGLLQAKHREAKLEGARVEALGNGESTSLRSIVERTLSQLPTDSTQTITFQFGHLLTPSKSTENDLEAPIPGSWPMEPTSPWHKLSTPVFSPALPPALIHFPLPQPRRIRRVTYRSEDGSQVSADYAYPQTVEEAVQMDQEDRPWIKEIDKMLARSTLPETKDGEMAFDFDALRGLIEADKPVPFHPLEVTARHTVSAVEDVLFPDRPTDMRIVARGESTVELPQLGDFFDKVHERAHSAAEIPLDDLKALRLGGEVPKNRAADVEDEPESEFEVEDMQETEVLPEPEVQPEPVADLESQHAEEAIAEAESEAVESSAEGSEASETSPRPQPPQPQPEPITPPPTLEFNGKLFKLQQDAIIELSESAAPVDDGDVAKPILRTLAVADLTGTGGVSRYAELQGRVGESLWRELASVSREVPPSSLGRGVRM